MTAAPALTTERAQERPPALPALTGLRFFAALWVVLYHLHAWRPAVLPLPAPSGAFAPLASMVATVMNAGSCAVNLFFVLSGFVLAYSYGGPQTGGRLRGGARAFYVARAARLYPAYLGALLLALAPALWGTQGPLHWPAGAATLLLLQAWLPLGANPLAWNGPGWSLSAEAFFYALFPLLLRVLGRAHTRGLHAALAGCWLSSLALVFLYDAGPPAGQRALDFRMYFHPVVHLPEFAFGLVLGLLFARGALGPAPRGAASASALLIALLLVRAPLPWLYLHNGLLEPLFAVLILALAPTRTRTRRHATGPSRRARSRRAGGLLGSPLLVALGEASYSLYLLHGPVVDWLGRLGLLPPAPWPWGLGALGPLLLILAGALLSYRLVERPARRALLRRFGEGG